MTTRSETENQAEADLNAQTILGDAMRVFNDFGNRIDSSRSPSRRPERPATPSSISISPTNSSA